MYRAIYNILRYFVIFVLSLSAVAAIFLVLINPESYFFGVRIFDNDALIHSFTIGGIAIFFAYLLFRDYKISKFLALGFFLYLLAEDMAFTLSFPSLPYPPFLVLIGLVPSIVLLFMKRK